MSVSVLIDRSLTKLPYTQNLKNKSWLSIILIILKATRVYSHFDKMISAPLQFKTTSIKV